MNWLRSLHVPQSVVVGLYLDLHSGIKKAIGTSPTTGNDWTNTFSGLNLFEFLVFLSGGVHSILFVLLLMIFNNQNNLLLIQLFGNRFEYRNQKRGIFNFITISRNKLWFKVYHENIKIINLIWLKSTLFTPTSILF